MAYNETMEEGMAPAATPEAAPAAPAPAGEDKGIYIPSDYLPPGIKNGDVLRVTGMDEDGCTFVHEPAEGGEEGEGGKAWEAGLRKEMSPREPQQEAM
jgi:hypothetical protein